MITQGKKSGGVKKKVVQQKRKSSECVLSSYPPSLQANTLRLVREMTLSMKVNKNGRHSSRAPSYLVVSGLFISVAYLRILHLSQMSRHTVIIVGSLNTRDSNISRWVLRRDVTSIYIQAFQSTGHRSNNDHWSLHGSNWRRVALKTGIGCPRNWLVCWFTNYLAVCSRQLPWHTHWVVPWGHQPLIGVIWTGQGIRPVAVVWPSLSQGVYSDRLLGLVELHKYDISGVVLRTQNTEL